MENPETSAVGENEEFLSNLCRRINAHLVFREEPPAEGKSRVSALMSGPGVSFGSSYEIESLPKDVREEAAASVIRQLLFPTVADAAGVPPASSFDELRLKLEVAGPV